MRRIENEKRNFNETSDLPSNESDTITADCEFENNAECDVAEDIHIGKICEQPTAMPKPAPSPIKLPNLFSHIPDSDTAFIIAIMFILFQEGCQDWVLFCILGYLIF